MNHPKSILNQLLKLSCLVPIKSKEEKITSKTSLWWKLYNKKRLAYIVAKNRENRVKKRLTLKKCAAFTSKFQKEQEKKLISCLNKHQITVPIPRLFKIKHPIIKGWNKANWWNKESIQQLLDKGLNYFTLLNKDNSYKGARIGCIDIDEPGWTKLPTKYWTRYISAGNGRIKILFLYKNNCGLKTSKGYFEGRYILDFKISGGIMGVASIHPITNKPYSLLGIGTIFLQNSKIYFSPQEVIDLLDKDWSIKIPNQKKIAASLKQEKVDCLIPSDSPCGARKLFFQDR